MATPAATPVPAGGSTSVPATPQAPETPRSAAAQRLRRVGGISLKTAAATAPAAPVADPAAAPPLDDEKLRRLWDEMVLEFKEQNPKAADQLAGRVLVRDDDDNFRLQVPNSYIESAIRPSLIPMLSILRRKAARPLLNCRIEVVHEERESTAYTPSEKFEAMCQKNRNLELLHRLLPEVDY